MDSITQAVLGASVQAALLGRWQGRKALMYGAALGTLPDLDVIIDYGDAIADMTYHRGFSHSLFVLSGLALLLTGLIRWWRPDAGYGSGRLLLTLWLVLITHPLLDAFTSYGTQLFWPLPVTPTAWSSVFIIDPGFTVPLLIAVIAGLLFGLRGRVARWPAIALGLAGAYLAFTVAGKLMADRRVDAVLEANGIDAQTVFTTPTPFNSLLWRVVVIDGERYYEGLVSWFDEAPPELVELPRGAALAEVLADSPKHARLVWFTDGILRYDVNGGRLVVTDLRMGVPGFHPFRFALAEQVGDRWRLIEDVDREVTARGDADRLLALWRRIWNQDARVPLERWAAELSRR
ncbi:metal-dependent hydrolase [Stutzerimonas urumqiensis]|uniref:metal-dependent hydrolase n=1 Tax=Stutzerimonas urumqiensis TaxID=638269 RepID=UPI003BABE412